MSAGCDSSQSDVCLLDRIPRYWFFLALWAHSASEEKCEQIVIGAQCIEKEPGEDLVIIIMWDVLTNTMVLVLRTVVSNENGRPGKDVHLYRMGRAEP